MIVNASYLMASMRDRSKPWGQLTSFHEMMKAFRAVVERLVHAAGTPNTHATHS